MKAATREWVRCAEEDFDVANALLRRRTKTAANSIGFHCQQCVEKYLKARLEEGSLNAPKTHDLIVLLQLLLPVEPLRHRRRGVGDELVQCDGDPMKKQIGPKATKPTKGSETLRYLGLLLSVR